MNLEGKTKGSILKFLESEILDISKIKKGKDGRNESEHDEKSTYFTLNEVLGSYLFTGILFLMEMYICSQWFQLGYLLSFFIPFLYNVLIGLYLFFRNKSIISFPGLLMFIPGTVIMGICIAILAVFMLFIGLIYGILYCLLSKIRGG